MFIEVDMGIIHISKRCSTKQIRSMQDSTNVSRDLKDARDYCTDAVAPGVIPHARC